MTDHQEGLAGVIAAMRNAEAEARTENEWHHDRGNAVAARCYACRADGIRHAADMLAAYHARLTTGRGTE